MLASPAIAPARRPRLAGYPTTAEPRPRTPDGRDPPRLEGSQLASPPALIRIRAALPRGLQTRRWWCRGCRQCMPRGTPLARGRAGQCLSRKSRNISQPGQPGHVTAHTCSSRLTLTLILALTRRRQQRAPRGGSPQEVQADEVRRHPLRTVDGESPKPNPHPPTASGPLRAVDGASRHVLTH